MGCRFNSIQFWKKNIKMNCFSKNNIDIQLAVSIWCMTWIAEGYKVVINNTWILENKSNQTLSYWIILILKVLILSLSFSLYPFTSLSFILTTILFLWETQTNRFVCVSANISAPWVHTWIKAKCELSNFSNFTLAE